MDVDDHCADSGTALDRTPAAGIDGGALNTSVAIVTTSRASFKTA
jgi:hypothetical protein